MLQFMRKPPSATLPIMIVGLVAGSLEVGTVVVQTDIEPTKDERPFLLSLFAREVPATTALRWLKTMVSEGLFIRRSDPHDGRRVFVELAPDTRNALNRYFAEVERVAAI